MSVPIPSEIRFRVEPGDVPPEKAARRLHLDSGPVHGNLAASVGARLPARGPRYRELRPGRDRSVEEIAVARAVRIDLSKANRASFGRPSR